MSSSSCSQEIPARTSNAPKRLGWYLQRFMQQYQPEHSQPLTRYRTMMLSFCAEFPDELARKPIREITFDEVLGLLDTTLRYKQHKTRMYVTILRYCYESAFRDGEITTNYMSYIHLRDLLASKTNITDDCYDAIKTAIYTVPGGRAYGLAAFLNTSFCSVGKIRYEHCSSDAKTVTFIKHGESHVTTLVDPDAIELLQSSRDDYLERMSDPAIARRNSEHLLFITKVGTPYTHNQFVWISKMVREKSGILDLDIDSLQKYLQTRIL